MQSDRMPTFEELLGRALLETEFRDRILSGDEELQVSALQEVGLSEADATKLLPQLNAAADAIRDLAEAGVFGARVHAA